jgi:hypothetical protein
MAILHVFVAWSDLKELACDAWLVPGGPGATWREGPPPGWNVRALFRMFVRVGMGSRGVSIEAMRDRLGMTRR